MAMNVGDPREGEPVSEINTTPLIDVMLVLLVMLIITLPPQRHAVKMDTPLPCKDCEQDPETPDRVRIAVDFDGRITWNGVEVSRAELDQRLAVEGRRAIQPEIQIAPNRIAAVWRRGSRDGGSPAQQAAADGYCGRDLTSSVQAAEPASHWRRPPTSSPRSRRGSRQNPSSTSFSPATFGIALSIT